MGDLPFVAGKIPRRRAVYDVSIMQRVRANRRCGREAQDRSLPRESSTRTHEIQQNLAKKLSFYLQPPRLVPDLQKIIEWIQCWHIVVPGLFEVDSTRYQLFKERSGSNSTDG